MVAAIAPLLIAACSLILRLFHIAAIKKPILDEVYYVDGARDLLAYGVEVDQASPEFVVHPPIGKWMIAIGIKIFGDNPLGWRIATAIVGTLMILLIALIAHKLFYSPLLTGLASALMALDGMALVHSRTAMLDNFLAFFILLATYFFVSRLYMWSGLFLGLALATKWSAAYFIALFGVIALYRVFNHYSGRDLIIPTLRRAIAFGVIPLSTYLVSWSGWFASNRGWGRDHSNNVFTSFVNYHSQILNFHTSLTENHNYQSNPWSWLILGRPTSFFYESPKNCGADSCAQEVIALGTPILWWLATIALAIVFGFWLRSIALRRRDPAASIIVVGMAAGYLPWFFMQHRTVFSFYSIVFEPFLILALVYCAKLLLQTQAKKSERAYLYAQMTIGSLLILIAINFIYFLPLYLGLSIPKSEWLARMWLQSWI